MSRHVGFGRRAENSSLVARPYVPDLKIPVFLFLAVACPFADALRQVLDVHRILGGVATPIAV